ncbi:MAG: SHOCT domain-containing protein [Clostridia bacterium]|nr:SHOCT domain-containing protein [Clostridia bacterium]
MLIGVALGVGLGVLTANLHLGIRMLIMGGLTLVLIGMSKGGVLNGVLRIDQILLPVGLFPAFAAEYAAFGGEEGRVKQFATPLAQPVQPDAHANTEILRALERLAKLREAGVLTDKEFERKKTELLGRM